ncbi:hypothetical protein GCM10010436_84180 [Paractinoplanes durhamensis]
MRQGRQRDVRESPRAPGADGRKRGGHGVEQSRLAHSDLAGDQNHAGPRIAYRGEDVTEFLRPADQCHAGIIPSRAACAKRVFAGPPAFTATGRRKGSAATRGETTAGSTSPGLWRWVITLGEPGARSRLRNLSCD